MIETAVLHDTHPDLRHCAAADVLFKLSGGYSRTAPAPAITFFREPEAAGVALSVEVDSIDDRANQKE